ncbi:FAD-dependent oxidoreductase [Streptomyces sp. Ac-502]|uniref:FAD-dependent oxidoreductase n=1 Tax=Streptomyces sp. Ac-502 TaxID=3342801 RepID=UPI0038625359
MEGGTKRLLDAITGESKAELRLFTPVTAVEGDGARATVITREGDRVRARHAVVALPLNALGDVTITPEVARSVRTMIEQKHPVKALRSPFRKIVVWHGGGTVLSFLGGEDGPAQAVGGQ